MEHPPPMPISQFLDLNQRHLPRYRHLRDEIELLKDASKPIPENLREDVKKVLQDSGDDIVGIILFLF